jgi:predicted transcriptional regulator
MSQREVLCLLEKNKGWLTAEEIHCLINTMNSLQMNKQSINESLNRLCRGGYIKRERDNTLKNGYKYKIN